MSVGSIQSFVSPLPRSNSVGGVAGPAPAVQTTDGASLGMDTVSLSGQKPPEGLPKDEDLGNQAGTENGTEKAVRAGEKRGHASETQKLSDEELKEIQKLEKRDAEVKKHEQAHIAAGGRYVLGGASFEYATGPDGGRYAVGGEVSIDLSEASDHHATIEKARAVRRAALAPAEPSAQDRRVAAQAMAMEASAREEISREIRQSDKAESDENVKAAPSTPAAPRPQPNAPLPENKEGSAAAELSKNPVEPSGEIAPMSVAASGAAAGVASAHGTAAGISGSMSPHGLGQNSAAAIARSAAVVGAVRTYTQNGLHAKSFPSQNTDATEAPHMAPGRKTSNYAGKATLDLRL